MRGKPAKVIRPVEKKISIPEDVVAQIDVLMWSELEGKVPFGAWSRLVTELLREHLARQQGALRG